MASDLENTIADAAAGPAEVEGKDSARVKQQPLRDLIAADQYLQEKSSVGRKRRGLLFTKLVPPGAS